MTKAIHEMTDEELTREIERLETLKVPSAPQPKRPRRLDDPGGAPKRRSIADLIEEEAKKNG
jgi:hypothetical protein